MTRMLAALVLLLAAARPATAQLLTRPALDWSTLETEHFVFHFPTSMEEWARDVASRMEGVREEVSGLVGHAPDRRVTVLVEDPSNVPNGFALPFRGAPTLFLWPTPPEPTGSLSNYRGWGELLAVHEFAHLAHLDRPSRNWRQRVTWRLMPVNLGPVARHSPRWVIEGYATYIEGKLTGSGRPAGAARAAVLRQWATEGQLPTYTQLDGSGRYMGGNMAYLAGSAFLEWLVEREGESSLPHLWRRMTARVDRSFDEAFVGVYGQPAEELYGRFTAQLTARAIALEDSIANREHRPGPDSLVQRLGWGTGGPAISPDGQLTAIVLRSATRPPRLVVWATADSTDTTAVRKAEADLLARDPEDVAPVRRLPTPRRPLHTLHATAGRGYLSPRFLPDGRRILTVRRVPTGDGSERPELFIWDLDDGTVRQLTHGAAIRDADPSPDGRTAAGVRCVDGVCSLVLVDLTGGAWREIAAGSPRRTFFRPRWSHDGKQLLVSVHEGGIWRLELVALDSGTTRRIGDGDINRYGGVFVDSNTIVATSEAGGIAHLELLSLDGTPPRTLTTTTGEHILPEWSVVGNSVHFLALHSRGYDLRRVELSASVAGTPPPFDVAFWPAVPPAMRHADTVPVLQPPPSRPYGLGPRSQRLLPGVVTGAEGTSGLLARNGTDPIGRLSWLVRGAAGDASAWRGAALDAELRALPASIGASIFGTNHQPSTGREGPVTASTSGSALDTRYLGAMLRAAVERDRGTTAWSAMAGASVGRLTPAGPAANAAGPTDGTRQLLATRIAGARRWDGDRRHLTAGLSLRAVGGRTVDSTWGRGAAALSLEGALWGLNGGASIRYAATTTGAPVYEQLLLGGLPSPLLDGSLLDQRWTEPSLPVAVARGTRAFGYRVESSVFGVRPFLAGMTVGDRLPHGWHRLVGAEYEFGVPSIPFVAIPAVRIVAGAARSLDAPFERTRGYLTVLYSP